MQRSGSLSLLSLPPVAGFSIRKTYRRAAMLTLEEEGQEPDQRVSCGASSLRLHMARLLKTLQ